MNLEELHQKFITEYPKLGISEQSSAMVKNSRLEAGLTQHELAKRMKTKQESIARAEKGDPKNTPSLNFMRRVAEACGKKFVMPRIE